MLTIIILVNCREYNSRKREEGLLVRGIIMIKLNTHLNKIIENKH
jgi:hypothetical protein